MEEEIHREAGDPVQMSPLTYRGTFKDGGDVVCRHMNTVERRRTHLQTRGSPQPQSAFYFCSGFGKEPHASMFSVSSHGVEQLVLEPPPRDALPPASHLARSLDAYLIAQNVFSLGDSLTRCTPRGRAPREG